MACQDATPDKKGGKAPLDFDRHKCWIEPRDLILPGPPERKKGKKTKEDKAKPFVHGLGVGCISHDQCACEVDHWTISEAEQLKDDKDVKSDEGGKEKAKGVKKEKEEDKEEKAEKASEKEDKAEKRSISKKPLDGKPGKANIATKDSTSEAHKEAEQAEDDSKQVDAEFIGRDLNQKSWCWSQGAFGVQLV